RSGSSRSSGTARRGSSPPAVGGERSTRVHRLPLYGREMDSQRSGPAPANYEIPAHPRMHAAVELVGTGWDLLGALDRRRLGQADQLAVEDRPPVGALLRRVDVVLDVVEVHVGDLLS